MPYNRTAENPNNIVGLKMPRLLRRRAYIGLAAQFETRSFQRWESLCLLSSRVDGHIQRHVQGKIYSSSLSLCCVITAKEIIEHAMLYKSNSAFAIPNGR